MKMTFFLNIYKVLWIKTKMLRYLYISYDNKSLEDTENGT